MTHHTTVATPTENVCHGLSCYSGSLLKEQVQQHLQTNVKHIDFKHSWSLELLTKLVTEDEMNSLTKAKTLSKQPQKSL